MFPLIETAMGFAAIMLVLSFLVKSLTSLISDTFDFYCDNFQYEASRLIRNITGRTWQSWTTDPAVVAAHPWVADVKWERLGDEFFSEDNITWVARQLVPGAILNDVKGLIKVHQGKVKFAFQQRLKNLSIAVGLGLCLLFDVNGLTIWQVLYQNDQLRTTFASDYATQALTLGSPAPAGGAKSTQADTAPTVESRLPSSTDVEKTEQNLSDARSAFSAKLRDFVRDVNFGVGKAWRSDAGERPSGVRGWLIEFVGAFLTGILVSVGAPYWHDLLEGLSSLRKSTA